MTTSLPRLWPYVLAGMICAWLLLSLFEPLPSTPPTSADRIWRCQSDLHC